ncbi:MAG: AMP-binding protein [Tepidisphaeraceae bacterium]
MRGPLDVMMRWWKETNDHGNGRGNGHGNGDAPATVSEAPAPPRQETTLEPPWLAQLDREGVPRSLHYPTTTLGRIVDQAAERFGDLPALVYNQNRWTYRELLARVNRMAGGLSRLGVRKGDRVVLTLPNCPEYVTAFLAVQKLGAVLVNAGPLMGLDDLRALMTLTSPHVVIALDLQAPQIIRAASASSPAHFVWVTLQSYQTLLKRLGYQIKLWHGREAATGSAAHVTLANLLENAPAKPPTIEPSPDATAVLQPTSGTTGSLKLAQLSHRNLLANAMQVAVWMSARDGQERVLTVLPMFHVYGLTTGLINPLFCAATITLLTRFDPAQTLDVLERERPTVFPLVPAICDALCSEIERRERPGASGEHSRVALPGLRACISGAAPLPRETAERFERLTGAVAVEGYGLSESSPVTHANPMSQPRYGSIGLPMPDTLCRVVDLDDGVTSASSVEPRDVPTGQPGELLVAGPQIMSGYYKNAEETQRALWTDEHGRTWLRTGDVVRMDEDGFFQVLDRKKDMIIRSGLKVYPAKVEKVLLAHERVADAAVVGRADSLHTEEVVAFIVVKSDDLDRDALAAELRALCRQHLAAYEVPSKFEFIDRIPRSALGKVLKKELRRLPADSPTKPQNPQRERKAA